MGKVIIPKSSKIRGPWLLDRKSLEELDEILMKIEVKLEEAFFMAVDSEAESRLEEFTRYEKEMDIAKAKNKVLLSCQFAKRDSYALFVTKQEKRIRDTTLLALIKDTQLNEYSPIELRVLMAKGPCEFSLDVSTKYGGELEFRVKTIDDEIFNDINYEIYKWIDNHKPSLIVQKWSSWFPWALFLVLPVLLFLL
jgi:hypothetical protein